MNKTLDKCLKLNAFHKQLKCLGHKLKQGRNLFRNQKRNDVVQDTG